MRIVMLTWEYPPRSVGGIAPHAQQLSRALVQRGHEVYVVTHLEGDAKPRENDRGVSVHRAQMSNPIPPDFITWVMQLNMNLVESVIGITQQFGRPDIIHAHDWLVAYAAKALKHSLVVPLVATIHATEAGRNWGLHNDLQRYIGDVEWWLAFEAWRVICCSGYMFDEVMRIFQLPADKVDVIPNGVNASEFEADSDIREFRRRYAADDEKIVYFVGRLVHEKGVHVLINAMPKVLAHFGKAKLVISGKGPAMDYLKSLASQLGIWEKVYFTGYVDDETRNNLYKAADIAVVPSLYEPFGITALEAMAARCPVAVSDVGGLNSTVEIGVNGYKFYSGNANSLADTILHVFFCPEDAKRVSRRAYAEVISKYSWSRIAALTEQTYDRVLNEFKSSEWSLTATEMVRNESGHHGRWEGHQVAPFDMRSAEADGAHSGQAHHGAYTQPSQGAWRS
jgi:glycogen(starch) synthase